MLILIGISTGSGVLAAGMSEKQQFELLIRNLDQAHQLQRVLDGECSESEPIGEIVSPPGELAIGARRVMATTYQSCGALRLAPYKPNRDPLLGVEQDPKSSIRRVTHLNELKKTHYYLKAYDPVHSSSCRDPSDPPPIYLFGAKPSEWKYFKKRELDLFDDRSHPDLCEGAGYECGGTPVRGVDCSGFVLSAMLTQGLRISPDKNVTFGGTSHFVQAATEKGSCFSTPPSGEKYATPLQSGDLYIVPGVHVFIVDEVGSDPFGLTQVADCNEVSPLYFDFKILQSSPSGGSIGVNRMEASDYFLDLVNRAQLESDPVSSAPMGFLGPMLAHARELCRISRGEAAAPSAVRGQGYFLRHEGETRPECVNPVGTRPKLLNEECIEGCSLAQNGEPLK